MTARQFVSICPVNSTESIDLEVPLNEPIKTLLPDLLKVLEQPLSLGGKALDYSLKTEDDEVIDENFTFADAKIENFQRLWLIFSKNVIRQDEDGNVKTATIIGSQISSVDGLQVLPEPPRGLQGLMSPLLWVQLPIEKPSLVSPSGLIFELGDKPMLIGRSSNNSKPDIDLSELDPELISSREHATIELTDNKAILKTLKPPNGTFVNGVLLDSGDTCDLKDGDAIQFGVTGVKLVFCLPKK